MSSFHQTSANIHEKLAHGIHSVLYLSTATHAGLACSKAALNAPQGSLHVCNRPTVKHNSSAAFVNMEIPRQAAVSCFLFVHQSQQGEEQGIAT
jgi:hypothetical protein